jgi:Domain of unknown function (DUF4360)
MAVAVGLSLLAPAASTAAGARERQPRLAVRLVSANGSGCRPGSTSPKMAEVQPSGAVTVRYRHFTVAGGDYRTCVLVLDVPTVAGWTYRIPSVRSQVRAELDASGTAGLATNMWLTGVDWTVTGEEQVTGPFNNVWNTSAASGPPTWAPCGQSFNLTIAETIRVAQPPSNTASLLTTTLNPPQWKRC